MSEILLVFLFPFAILGIYWLMTFLKEKWLVKKGFFRVIFRLSNHRKMVKWIKPDKDCITGRGLNKIYPFSDSIGFIYYNSSTPEIEYDVDGNQINFMEKKKTSDLDPSNLSSLGFRTYNLGKKHGKRGDSLVMILSAVAAGVGVLTLLLVMGLMQSLPA